MMKEKINKKRKIKEISNSVTKTTVQIVKDICNNHKKNINSDKITFNFNSPNTIPQTLPFQGPKRRFTVTVAIPTSIVSNAQTEILKAYLIGQIARTLTIFGIDEILIYDDLEKISGNQKVPSNELRFFINNLQYLETPQYLRKYLFPINSDLRYAGLLNPLDAPHHLRKEEWLPYREGVVVEPPSSTDLIGSFIFCGFDKPIFVKDLLPIGTRCTVKLKRSARNYFDRHISTFSTSFYPKGKIVSPSEPVIKSGIYWGYKINAIRTFPEIFDNCSFSDNKKFDLIIGTSQNGELFDAKIHLPQFKNLLIVLGGVEGLEPIFEKFDMKTSIGKIFSSYINVCPFQRSRTIRTEEALSIILSSFHPHLTSRS